MLPFSLFYQPLITITRMENQQVNSSRSFEPHLLPLLESFSTHFDHSFHDSDEQIDEDQCYLMEIEQLKRQNNFLKRKIAELSKHSPAVTQSKRKSMPLNCKPAQSITTLPQQNYVVAFFDEVIRLIESFSDLFKVSCSSTLKQDILKQEDHFNTLIKDNQEDLNKKLGRMLLEPQQKRYGKLLSIFQCFYKDSTQRTKSLKAKVEQLTTEAIQLGKKMALSIRSREKIKGSRILSQYNEQQQNRNYDQLTIMKQSFIKSTCHESQLDLSSFRIMLSKDRLFQNIF